MLEPRALDELLPDWREDDSAPIRQPALKDDMRLLTSSASFPLPHPPEMSNKGNYIVSLSEVVKWLGERAEALGVEIYPGQAASETLFTEAGEVRGVATRDMGLDRAGLPKASFERGMEFHARVTLFAEGAHGSLTKPLIKTFNLRKDSQPQTYGIGIKEVWEVDPSVHQPGTVIHTLGYPLDSHTYGGGFLYHLNGNRISLGLVVGLDYSNPYLNPYKEFQKFKSHPSIRPLLEAKGSKCLEYGARALNEGGLQSVPHLAFPGGALIGCSAGFVNVPKIKGSHTAMKTGMLAAETAFQELSASPEDSSAPLTMKAYPKAYKESWVYQELWRVRNVRPSFNNPLGLWGGLLWSGIDTLFLRGHAPFTFSHHSTDAASLVPARNANPISYPKPDGKVTFDLLESVSRSGTMHREDEPIHLRLRNKDIPVQRNLAIYDGPEGRFCPAGVYEFVDDSSSSSGKRLQINAQNCVHCKTCDIKDPSQNIDWVVPEGGDGPKYSMT